MSLVACTGGEVQPITGAHSMVVAKAQRPRQRGLDDLLRDANNMRSKRTACVGRIRRSPGPGLHNAGSGSASVIGFRNVEL